MSEQGREPGYTTHVLRVLDVVDAAGVKHFAAAQCLYCGWFSPVRLTRDDAHADAEFHSTAMSNLAAGRRGAAS